MNLLTALNWRYAVRRFSDQVVTEDQLEQLLHAIVLSPSSYGLQPYRVLVVKNQALQQQLVAHAYGQDKVADCSHLLVLAADTDIGETTVARYFENYVKANGQQADPNALANYRDHLSSALAAKSPQQKQRWAAEQVFIALGNLVTSAALLNIDACPMTGFDVAGFNQVLGLDELGLTATATCPIGYRHADDKNAEQAKVRRSLAEFVITK